MPVNWARVLAFVALILAVPVILFVIALQLRRLGFW